MKHKILKAIYAWELEGHTWITGSQLEQAVTNSMVQFDLALYAQALSALVQSQILLVVGKSYATAYTYHLENEISVAVGKKIKRTIPSLPLAKELPAHLSPAQREAVTMVGTHPVSLVVGANGTGKSTTAAMLADLYDPVVLTAATDKGLGTLFAMATTSPKTLTTACTSHLLHWDPVKLVVVDQAELLTRKDFHALLGLLPRDCHLVLVGCPVAPFPCGAGNLVYDLQRANIPAVTLTQVVRPHCPFSALAYNQTCQDICYDKSFNFYPLEDSTHLPGQLIGMASTDFFQQKNSQIITADERVNLRINDNLQRAVNLGQKVKGNDFYQMDRVIIFERDPYENIYANDIGRLSFMSPQSGDGEFTVPYNRSTLTYDNDNLRERYSLAYALNYEEAYGSEFETVYIFLLDNNPLQNRTTLLTAIASATTTVHIFATADTLAQTLKTLRYHTQTHLVEYLRDEMNPMKV